MSAGEGTKIRVAICGGGLAGACLLIALLQQKHIDVHVFESAASFEGEGAAVGITSNASRALHMISPDAVHCLEEASAVDIGILKLMVGSGPHQGQQIGTLDRKSLVRVVMRRALLHELLREVPAGVLHPNKALLRVEGEKELTLHFKDGSSHVCDVLVGADGIHSRVRRLILGDDDPASDPVFAHWASIMAIKPYDEVRRELGADLIDKDRPYQYAWCGKDAFFMHNVLGNGRLVQIIAGLSFADHAWDPSEWKKSMTADEVKSRFEGWMPWIKDTAIPYLCKDERLMAMSTWAHADARTYAKGAMCAMGDAAHATMPMQGSGGGMAIEDAAILSSLLASVRTRRDICPALQAYSQIRLPRTQAIVDSSRETGQLFSGRVAEVGLDSEKLRGALLNKWDFILDIDLEEHRRQALRLLQVMISESESAT